MALAILFSPVSMNEEQYRETLHRLEAGDEGAGTPGRLFHVCFGRGDRLRVLDVWESAEAFERFGGVLQPILQEVGIDPGPPEIAPMVNVQASAQPAVT